MKFLIIRTFWLALLILFFTQSPTSLAQSDPNQDKTEEQKKSQIDWGDWNIKSPKTTPPVINKKDALKAELRDLDQSKVLDENQGVTTKKLDLGKAQDKPKTVKNIKAMMKELEKLEAELKQEIRNDSEF